MKFSYSVHINQPIQAVSDLFQNDQLRKNWMPTFISIEPLKGEPGKEGSTARIMFETPGGPNELIETIIVNKLPYEFLGFYVHKHMENTMLNKFIEISETETLYEVEIEYTNFTGWIPKIISKLMPSMFQKPVQQQLDDFKAYAEKNL